MRQVWNQSGLFIGKSEQGAWAIHTKEGMTDPTDGHLEDATNKEAEEYHTIIFLYLADQQHYSKILEDMENAMLRKKTLSQECKWRMLTTNQLA